MKIKCIINTLPSQHHKCFKFQPILDQSFPQREKHFFKVFINSCFLSAVFSLWFSKRNPEKTNNSVYVCTAKLPFELPLIKSLSTFCCFIPPGDIRRH